MEADLSLKTVRVTLAQSVLECPHCHKPGYSFIAPVGVTCLRIVGECPACKGIFVIQIVDGAEIDAVRRSVAENIYHIMCEANREVTLDIRKVLDKIVAVLRSTPKLEVLEQVPEFEVSRVSTGLAVLAKNASASNILDMLKDMQAPLDIEHNMLTGV